MARSLLGWSATITFGLGLIAVVVGVVYNDVLSLVPLSHISVQRQLLYTTILIALFLAWILKLSIVGALLITWLFMAVNHVGLLPILSAVLLGSAGFRIGHHMFNDQNGAIDVSVKTVYGLGVISAVIGWLLPFPIHSQISYAVALVMVVALLGRRSSDVIAAGNVLACLRAKQPLAALFAVSVVGFMSVGLWLPDFMYDDLVYHLGLASQLEELGYYRMDVKTQIWALAPWSSGIMNAVVSLLSGSPGRGAINLLWILLVVALLWRVGQQIGLARHLRFWSIALFASLPLSLVLASGLQTELPSTVVMLALVSLILAYPTSPRSAGLIAFASLLGFLMAFKVSNVLIAAPLTLWATIRWHQTIDVKLIPLCALVFILMSGSSYFYALLVTGNPVLPLFNDVFRSDLFDLTPFMDSRWHNGFDWSLPWRLTYHTQDYFEGWAGAAGFIFVGMLGLIPFALSVASVRPLVLIGLFAVCAPLFFVQYLRYAYPGLVLLFPAVLFLFQKVPKAPIVVICGALISLNLAFQGNAHWIYRSGVVDRLLDSDKRSIQQLYVPEKDFAQWVFAQEPSDFRILLTDPSRPFHTAFAGRAFTVAWYDRELYDATKRGRAELSPSEWQAIWSNYGITHILVSDNSPPNVLIAAGDATSVHSAGGMTLLAINQATDAKDIVGDRDVARKMRDSITRALKWF